MIYSILQALKRILKNAFIYFFIVLEISVGVTILVCGVNTKSAMQDKLERINQQIGQSYVEIESGIKDTNAVNALSAKLFTYDVYQYLSKEYENEVSTDLYVRCSVFLKCKVADEYKIDSFYVICASDTLIARWLNLTENNSSIYYGNAFEDFLQSGNIEEVTTDSTVSSIMSVDYDKTAMSINGGESLPMIALPANTVQNFSVSSMDIENIKTSKCIFLPFSYISALDNLTYCTRTLYIKMNDANSYSAIYGMLNYLNENIDGCTFTLTDPVAELIKGGNDTTGQIQSLTYLAAFSFIIITVGIIGILMILLQQRKKSIAICYMLGASKARITFELFLEIAAICIIGGTIGLILSYFITPIFSVVYFEVIYKYKIVIPLVAVLMFTINVTSCAVAVMSVKESAPVQSMGGNG